MTTNPDLRDSRLRQQVYLHRKLTAAELDAKEKSCRETFKRTMQAISIVRKERDQ